MNGPSKSLVMIASPAQLSFFATERSKASGVAAQMPSPPKTPSPFGFVFDVQTLPAGPFGISAAAIGAK